MKTKLLFNSISGTLLYFASIVAAFIISPLLIKTLGDRDYGLWELIMSVIGYMGLLDLGMGGALVQFVALADGKRDNDDLQKTISTATVFFAVPGILCALVFGVLSFNPSLLGNIDNGKTANLSIVLGLLSLNSLILFPLQVYISTLLGLQRHYFIDGVRIVVVVTRTFILIMLFRRYPADGLVILAILETCFTVVQASFFVGAIHRNTGMPQINLRAIDREKAKDMLVFGAKNIVMTMASRMQNQSVPLIIGYSLGLGQIVFFVLPNRLVDYAKGLAQAIGYPLTPYFGETIGKGNDIDLCRQWLETTFVLQFVSLAMPVVLFFCGESFLNLWIGPEYGAQGKPILYVLLVGLVADALAVNAFRILTAYGKHGQSAFCWLISAAASIPLGILGAHAYGIVGVAAAVTVASAAGNAATLYLACKEMQVGIGTYISKTLLRLLLPLGILALIMELLGWMMPIDSYLDLLLHLLVAGGVYAGALWKLSLTVTIRQQLCKKLQDWRPA